MPTGGVTLENIREFYLSGAVAFGVGSALVGNGPKRVRRIQGDFDHPHPSGIQSFDHGGDVVRPANDGNELVFQYGGQGVHYRSN